MSYKRMWENKGHRPWYSICHLGGIAKAFREVSGFGYQKTIYLVTNDMTNKAYFEEKEMARATMYFKKLYQDQARTRKLLQTVRTRFQEAERIEAWGWKQKLVNKNTEELLKECVATFRAWYRIFATMLISQPQHVISLEDRISKLLQKYQNRDELLREATYYPGSMPWAKEKEELKELYKRWKRLSPKTKRKALDDLVKRYGWFNAIEGDTPFDRTHYQKEIEHFVPEKEYKPKGFKISAAIKELGQLIGELGYLRFWNRWHFMHVRYHIKMMHAELVKRSKNPALEYATIEELTRFFGGDKIDFREIKARKNGYVTIIENDDGKIVIGKAAQKYIKLCEEKIGKQTEIRGCIANAGKVRGAVRIISFAAKDYDEQVAAFKKGEILVTGMTRPQIVHLCQKSAAIVTDEGGITSHAAVVSRELGLPCIIATGSATKILKTGELVEVDANKGFVRKL